MPFKSQAQRRWAYANKDKKGSEGSAAREYIAHDDGRKLPERSKRSKALYTHPRSKKH